MIVGIGVDIVSTKRMKSIIDNFGNTFLEHTFTENELHNAANHHNQFQYFSTRFAAKEAAFKALSSVIDNTFDLREIETLNHENGAPYISISGNLEKIINENHVSSINISLSDEEEYVVAFVCVEGN